eukprot:3805466-Amphidinium_carterae.1
MRAEPSRRTREVYVGAFFEPKFTIGLQRASATVKVVDDPETRLRTTPLDGVYFSDAAKRPHSGSVFTCSSAVVSKEGTQQ